MTHSTVFSDRRRQLLHTLVRLGYVGCHSTLPFLETADLHLESYDCASYDVAVTKQFQVLVDVFKPDFLQVCLIFSCWADATISLGGFWVIGFLSSRSMSGFESRASSGALATSENNKHHA